MQYNPFLEIGALPFLVVAAVQYFARPHHPSRQNRFFGVFAVLGFFDVSIDIASAFLIEASATVAPWINMTVHMTLYGCQVALAPMLLLYVLCLTDAVHRNTLWLIALALMPCFVTFGMLLSNPRTAAFFYFDAAGGYHHGDGFKWLYVGTVLYLLLSAVMLLLRRRRLRRIQFNVVMIYTCAIVGAMVLQTLFPNYQITGVLICVAICMMYITIENPDQMLDALSGAYNRRSFLLQTETLLKRKRRFQLIYIDPEDMRAVNRTFGVRSGDLAIAEIGKYLIHIAGTNRVFRLIGDSFVVITHNEEKAMQIVEHVGARFSECWKAGELPVQIRAHICYAFSAYRCASVGEIQELLDFALAKVRSEEVWTPYRVDEDARKRILRDKEIEVILRRSLELHTVEIALQPICSLADNAVRGAEALARLRDAQGRIVMPGEFVPIAERTGLVVQLGEQMIEKACAFLHEYALDQDPKFERICINLSPVECLDGSLQGKIERAAYHYGIRTGKLCFEITETAATASEKLPEVMRKLRQRGFCFSLDDFGTGYANYDAIMRLPFSVVKIDKSLLDISEESRRNNILFTRTIEMVRDLGYDVVVEGVEKVEQAEMLKQRNVAYAQGYYFSRPVTGAVFIRLFREGLRLAG